MDEFFFVDGALIVDVNSFVPAHLQIIPPDGQQIPEALIIEWIAEMTGNPAAAATIAALQAILLGSPTVFPIEGNDGNVKINGGAGGVMPEWPNGGPDSIDSTWQPIVYTTPLTLSGVTKWPNNIITPTDADVYLVGTNTFIENPVDLQVHLWRLQFEFEKQSSQTNLEIRLMNPLSGFTLETFTNFASGLTDGHLIATFVTVADSASLPPPLGTGQGYVFEVRADNNSFQQSPGHFLRVESLTRISQYHTARATP